MRKMKIAGILIFCAALAGCFFSTILIPQKEISDRENRALETKPAFAMEDILSGEYQAHYETYLNDQMFFRDQWVSLAAAMECMMGKKDINGVYIGKDGYLLEKFEKSDFDAAQAEENIRILSEFLNDAASRYGSGSVACILVPSKAEVLLNRLPVFAEVSDVQERTAEALKERLKEPQFLLDAAGVLRSHQEEYIYYRTDHHWTTLGAYYVYQAWAQLAQQRAKPLESYERETVFTDFYGTTYNKAQVRVPADRVELFHSSGEEGVRVIGDEGKLESDSFYFKEEAAEGFDRYRVFFSKNTAEITVTTKAQTGRTLLLVKDSFANCFAPFLAEDFEKIIMIDCRYGKENVRDLMEAHEEITDVIVMYNTEKFMQDTNLERLDKKSDTMEEFDMEDFFSDME